VDRSKTKQGGAAEPSKPAELVKSRQMKSLWT